MFSTVDTQLYDEAMEVQFHTSHLVFLVVLIQFSDYVFLVVLIQFSDY